MDSILAISPPVKLNKNVVIGLCNDNESVFEHMAMVMDEFANLEEHVFSNKNNIVAVHGLKRILEWSGIRDWDFAAHPVYDVKLMGYLLNPDEEPRLSRLVRTYLGMDYPYGVPTISDLETDALPRLLAQDAKFTYILAPKLRSLMGNSLWRLYEEVELPLVLILARMHLDGVGVDGAVCTRELKKLAVLLKELEQEITQGEPVDLSSNAEVDLLLQKRGISLHPGSQLEDFSFILVVAQILEWRRIKQEDLSFLQRAAGSDRIHPAWRQTRGATGRIFSSVVPVQSISKEKYRPLLKAAPGHVLLKPDYSQMQLRLLAHLSGDTQLKETFRRGEDIHSKTADELSVTRQQAKTINFGICFGQGAESLAADMGISLEQAQFHIDGFFKTYAVAGDFFGATVSQVKKQKRNERVVTSPFGRIRRFPHRLTDHEQRKIRITPLQQFEADIVKRAMVLIERAFLERGMCSRIVMMIHDSIWIESPEEETKDAMAISKEVMTTVVDLDVPLEVKFE